MDMNGTGVARISEQMVARTQAISLRQLRFFVALAQHGHFGRTADEMAVSQPALSAAIRQVETLLDLRLFDRTTHRVALTEAGRALLPHAQRLLTTADNAFNDMREAVVRETTTVRIGAIPSAIPAVAEALAALRTAVPQVMPHLEDGKRDTLMAGLHKGAFDMIVSISGRQDPAIEARTLIEDEMLLLVHESHALAREGKLPWRALEGQEIVHFAGGSIGELTSAALQQNGLAPSSRFRVDQVDSLYGLVRSGLAVGVMPRLYTRALGNDGLRLVPLIRPTVKRRIQLQHRPQLAQEHPIAADFCRRLGEKLRKAFSSETTV